MNRRLPVVLLFILATLLAIVGYRLLPSGPALPVRGQVGQVTPSDLAAASGVAYLQTADGAADWGPVAGGNVNDARQQEAVGTAALVGLALMTSGVPRETDASIQRAHKLVLDAAPALTHTEPLCWSIAFLDRHGGSDARVIAGLTVRLAVSQHANGCWGDEAYPLTRQQEDEWTRWLVNRKDQTRLHRSETREALQRPAPDRRHVQLALLALGHGRRSLPPGALNYACLRTAAQFSGTQRADGGWGKTPAAPPDPVTTCAGLLAHAVRWGTDDQRLDEVQRRQARDFLKEALQFSYAPQESRPADPSVAELVQRLGADSFQTRITARKQLENLGIESLAELKEVLKSTTDVEVKRRLAEVLPGLEARAALVSTPLPARLWAYSHVATTYDWHVTNGWDWYGWGTNELLRTQGDDGSWTVAADKVRPTALALLFLKGRSLFRFESH